MGKTIAFKNEDSMASKGLNEFAENIISRKHQIENDHIRFLSEKLTKAEKQVSELLQFLKDNHPSVLEDFTKLKK